MIAELEKFDRNLSRYWKNHLFHTLVKEVQETKKRHHKMSQRQRIESYKSLRYSTQLLATPTDVTNYKDMPYEKLIQLYKTHKQDTKERKSDKCEYPWERTPSDFSIKKTFINVCNNMSNRVKTAVTGTLESMKKRIGKKSKEEKK
ncbi:unnamed protein product [Caenorhabditis nigoni]